MFGVEFNRQMVPYTLSSLVKELAKKIGGNHYSKLHHDLGNKLMQLDTRLQSTDVVILFYFMNVSIALDFEFVYCLI